MEMLVIALVALIAFAAVLVPLFRRDRHGQPRTSADPPADRAPPRPAADMTAQQDAVRVAPQDAVRVAPPTDAAHATPVADVPDDVELEVQRYRSAVRANTVCRRCGQANPAASAFCFDCGSTLAVTDAKEFE